jgi:plastocyanin
MRKTLAVAVVAVALAACGGDGGGESEGNGDGGAASGTSTVTLQDNTFSPANPTISAGEVELVNEGEAPHTFTVEGEDVDVELEAGQSTTTTVDLAPGTYTLFCEFHREQGMEATLTVE